MLRKRGGDQVKCFLDFGFMANCVYVTCGFHVKIDILYLPLEAGVSYSL